MPVLSTTHHKLYYTTQGERVKPPLLLLHGFLGSHQDFLPLMSVLSSHFYCIAVDLPGHGKTRSHTDVCTDDEPNGYTFPAVADSLLSLLNHLNIEQTHLLGYSMGGRLALYLACTFPERFLQVVLESVSPGLKTAAERKKRRESDGAIAHRLQTTPLPTFLTQWYANPLFASLHNHPDAYAAMLQRREQNNAAELAIALKGLSLGAQPSLWTKLTQIKQPPLLLVGALDAKFIGINQDMVALLSANHSATLAVVEACGHNIHLESPTIYGLTVLSFLDDII